jgi:hypothetical protein
MKETVESSPLRIDHPATAAVFAKPLPRRVLMAFAEARSMTEAAALVGLPLARIHYHARRLTELGLLRVVRSHKRGGRPIRIYRASARTYFVPLALLPALPQPELARALRAALEAQRIAGSAGMLVAAGPEGRITVRHVGGAGEGLDAWLSLPLAASQARALADDLRALLARYASAASRGRSRRPYIVRAALAKVREFRGP